MSCSTLYGLWPNETRRVKLAEFRNAWGMAPLVWNVMAQRYLGMPPHCYFNRMEDLWSLHARGDIPVSDRAVLRMTFDTAFIRREDCRRAIDDIALFLHAFNREIDPDAVNHWPRLATSLITQWSDNPSAFGVHQTSVSVNPWDGPYDEATDERGPFDWSKAYSVYDGLPGRTR